MSYFMYNPSKMGDWLSWTNKVHINWRIACLQSIAFLAQTCILRQLIVNSILLWDLMTRSMPKCLYSMHNFLLSLWQSYL